MGRGALGLLDQLDQLLVLAILGQLGDGDRDGTIPVDRPGHYLITDPLVDRLGFPGQRGLVEQAGSFDDLTVDRDQLPGLDQDVLTNLDGVDLDVLTAIRGDDVGHLGRVVEQGLELRVGLLGGVVLEGITPGQHDQDDHRSPVLADGQGGNHGQDGQQVNPVLTGAQGLDHADEHGQCHHGPDHGDQDLGKKRFVKDVLEQEGDCRNHEDQDQLLLV